MKIVNVNLGERSYKIYIGTNIINRISSFMDFETDDIPLFVVTNRKINRLHGHKLRKILDAISLSILFREVPDSEKAKSFPTYIRTIRAVARFAKKTKPIVFALGGGVIGDLAGFVASAYRRGVPYAQIPTTLLAQVDSAIGGKVAIDIKEAKNIVGNFYQPKLVLCDLQFLKTLPEKILREGLIEVVKYGIIKDRTLFNYLEKNLAKILKRDEKALEHIVFKSCGIKAKTVERDELDTKDVRIVLNFGHTIGHAIETASGYSNAISHGQAVGLGMIMASRIALKLKIINANEHKRIESLIKRVIPVEKIKLPKANDILRAVSYDKKFIYGTNRFILPARIGLAKVVDKIPQSLIKQAIEEQGGCDHET